MTLDRVTIASPRWGKKYQKSIKEPRMRRAQQYQTEMKQANTVIANINRIQETNRPMMAAGMISASTTIDLWNQLTTRMRRTDGADECVISGLTDEYYSTTKKSAITSVMRKNRTTPLLDSIVLNNCWKSECFFLLRSELEQSALSAICTSSSRLTANLW